MSSSPMLIAMFHYRLPLRTLRCWRVYVSSYVHWPSQPPLGSGKLRAMAQTSSPLNLKEVDGEKPFCNELFIKKTRTFTALSEETVPDFRLPTLWGVEYDLPCAKPLKLLLQGQNNTIDGHFMPVRFVLGLMVTFQGVSFNFSKLDRDSMYTSQWSNRPRGMLHVMKKLRLSCVLDHLYSSDSQCMNDLVKFLPGCTV